MKLAGGMEFPPPHGVLVSPNLTPDLRTGIGQWTEAAFVQRFKIYADPAYHAPAVGKDGFATPMPWMLYAGMKESDLAAIYAYLMTVPAVPNKVLRFERRSPIKPVSH